MASWKDSRLVGAMMAALAVAPMAARAQAGAKPPVSSAPAVTDTVSPPPASAAAPDETASLATIEGRVDRVQLMLSQEDINLTAYYLLRSMSDETYARKAVVTASPADVAAYRAAVMDWGSATDRMVLQGVARYSAHDVQVVLDKQKILDAAAHRIDGGFIIPYDDDYAGFPQNYAARAIIDNAISLGKSMTGKPNGPTPLDMISPSRTEGEKSHARWAALVIYAIVASGAQNAEDQQAAVTVLQEDEKFLGFFLARIGIVRDISDAVKSALTRGALMAPEMENQSQLFGMAMEDNLVNVTAYVGAKLGIASSPRATPAPDVVTQAPGMKHASLDLGRPAQCVTLVNGR